MNTTIRTSIRRPFLRSAFVLITLALTCVGLLPKAQAVSPPPDGGYPNFTTAEGQNALLSLTSGTGNTAVGWFSLKSDTTGGFNTGVGAGTLVLNSGDENTATGVAALLLNSTGTQNTANGVGALLNNTTGSDNTAYGFEALYSNTSGGGFVSGGGNTAIGGSALNSNTIGNNNTALGFFAGYDLTTGDNNIDIGNEGVADESNTIRIGKFQTRTFIAGISGVDEGGTPLAVYINGNGRLGTVSSSRRFKKEIKPMDGASESILALKPVTFHYKSDSTGAPQFGLIAEEVAEINPDLVVRDENGEIYTVRYDAVNAMLLNEFLKEHRKVEGQAREMQEQKSIVSQLKSTVAAQQVIIAQQQKGMGVLRAQLKEQAAQIQKVSAQIEANRSAPQVVVSP